MVGRGLVAAVALLVAAFAASSSAAPQAVRLTKKQQAELYESLIPAYEFGDPVQLLKRASDFVNKLDEARLAAANKLLAARGLPSVDQMLADSRLTMVHQNRISEMAAPHPRELLVTLRELTARIDEAISAQEKHPVMSDPLPRAENLDRYQELFWELHVLDNQLANAARIAEYAQQLTELGSKRLNLKAIDDGKKLLATDFPAVKLDITRRRREMEEREIEMRIYQIEDAEAVLAESKKSRDRFLAAYVLDLNGYLIADFYQQRSANPQNGFVRQELADKSLPEWMQQTVASGRENAGDLVKKTELLYTGLHWWLRGRYGAGPEAFGLLKNREALASDAAQFPLYMPQITPEPTDPMSDVQQIPQVDRRHHYTWATEYRPISSNSGSSSSQQSVTRMNNGTVSTTHLSRFY